MRIAITFFAIIASLASSQIDAACKCKDCHCTKESHCGCLSSGVNSPYAESESKEPKF